MRALRVDRAVPLGVAATWTVEFGVDVSAWSFAFLVESKLGAALPVASAIDVSSAASGSVVVSVSASEVEALGVGEWVVALMASVDGSDLIPMFVGLLAVYDRSVSRPPCANTSDVVTIDRWA